MPRIASARFGTAQAASSPMLPRAWAAPEAVRASSSFKDWQRSKMTTLACGPSLPNPHTALHRMYLSLWESIRTRTGIASRPSWAIAWAAPSRTRGSESFSAAVKSGRASRARVPNLVIDRRAPSRIEGLWWCVSAIRAGRVSSASVISGPEMVGQYPIVVSTPSGRCRNLDHTLPVAKSILVAAERIKIRQRLLFRRIFRHSIAGEKRISPRPV